MKKAKARRRWRHKEHDGGRRQRHEGDEGRRSKKV